MSLSLKEYIEAVIRSVDDIAGSGTISFELTLNDSGEPDIHGQHKVKFALDIGEKLPIELQALYDEWQSGQDKGTA